MAAWRCERIDTIAPGGDADLMDQAEAGDAVALGAWEAAAFVLDEADDPRGAVCDGCGAVLHPSGAVRAIAVLHFDTGSPTAYRRALAYCRGCASPFDAMQRRAAARADAIERDMVVH